MEQQAKVPTPRTVTASVDIAAPQRTVWTVLVDVAAWPTWNPAIRHAVCDTELEVEVGTRFRFATEIGTLKCRVTEIDAPRVFAWRGRVLAVAERQRWRLETTEHGTHVTVDAEMGGLSAVLFRRRLDDRLRQVLDALVQLLRLEAEARASEISEAARVAAPGTGDQGRG